MDNKFIYKSGTAWYIPHEAFISPVSKIMLKTKLSTEDFKKNLVSVGYFENQGYVKVPAIPRSLIENLIKPEYNIKNINPITPKINEFNLKWSELSHQVKLINDITSSFKSGEARACLSLDPGLGKTFIALSIAKRLKVVQLFVTKSDTLKNQTYEAFKDASDLSGILVVDSSAGFQKMVETHCDEIRCVIITHSMIRSIFEIYGEAYFSEALKRIGIGMIVFDEFDLEVANIYKISVLVNIKYNLYLTGTKFKSLKPDDAVFKLVFRSAPDFGSDIKLKPNKDIDLFHIKSSPAPPETSSIHFRGMFQMNTYNKILNQKDFIYDSLKKYYYDSNYFNELVKEDGQIVFFVGRIETCEIVKNRLIKEWGIREDDIGIINTSIKGSERKKNFNKPYIVSIMESMGRGLDMKNLRCIILMEFHFSLSSFIQTINRVGRVGKENGRVIYIVDESFSRVVYTYKKRRVILPDKFNQINTIKNEDPDSSIYKFGYRSTNPDLAKIEAKMKKSKAKAVTRFSVDEYLKGFIFGNELIPEVSEYMDQEPYFPIQVSDDDFQM